MKEKRLHPRAILLWNTVVKITSLKKKGDDKVAIFAVLRDVSLVKNYCNGFGFECKTIDAEKINNEEKATIKIMAEINKDVQEIDIPVTIIKERGKKSLGAKMDKEFEKSRKKHPLLEEWIKELKKDGKILLPDLLFKLFGYMNSNEFHTALISSVAKKIVKNLPLEKIPDGDYSALEKKLVRFLKADYDFRSGVLRREFLKICFKKKASSELDNEDKWKAIKQELAEKKSTDIMKIERFKKWI